MVYYVTFCRSTFPNPTSTFTLSPPLHLDPISPRRDLNRTTAGCASNRKPVGTVASSATPQSNLYHRKPAQSQPASSPASRPDRIVVREPAAVVGSRLPFWQQNWLLALLFAMAMALVAMSLVLYLGLDIDGGSPAVGFAAPDTEGVEITYGSAIKLMHEKTKSRLHSHEVPYGTGSGQQSVTGFPQVDDANSYWIVRPVADTSAKSGDRIESGTIIRLQHMKTRRWLHSHLHASPLSGNLEVSCYGGEHQSDTGDYWRLMIEGSGKTWKQDQRVRLQHVDTQGYLHSHNKKYQRIAGGQQEVCGMGEKRADNIWLAAEGVYLPTH